MQDAGFDVQTEEQTGDPGSVLPTLVKARAPALLVMGAPVRSGFWQLLGGSTTARLLKRSDVPVLANAICAAERPAFALCTSAAWQRSRRAVQISRSRLVASSSKTLCR